MRMDVFLGAVCDAVWWAASRLTHSTPQRRGPDRTTGIGMCVLGAAMREGEPLRTYLWSYL